MNKDLMDALIAGVGCLIYSVLMIVVAVIGLKSILKDEQDADDRKDRDGKDL